MASLISSWGSCTVGLKKVSWPWTHCIAEDDLEVKLLPVPSTFGMLGLQLCPSVATLCCPGVQFRSLLLLGKDSSLICILAQYLHTEFESVSVFVPRNKRFFPPPVVFHGLSFSYRNTFWWKMDTCSNMFMLHTSDVSLGFSSKSMWGWKTPACSPPVCPSPPALSVWRHSFFQQTETLWVFLLLFLIIDPKMGNKYDFEIAYWFSLPENQLFRLCGKQAPSSLSLSSVCGVFSQG